MHTNSAALRESSSDLSACLEHLAAGRQALTPLSTYRLQFNCAFRFEDARRLIPYLSKLGISHCYASPILKARAGSQHGYDIIDHNQLNPEIGTEEEFRSFVRGTESTWHGAAFSTPCRTTWAWATAAIPGGRTSCRTAELRHYADFFDIDWEPLKPELRNKVLLPILGSPTAKIWRQATSRFILRTAVSL